jgi:hypothetical protein
MNKLQEDYADIMTELCGPKNIHLLYNAATKVKLPEEVLLRIIVLLSCLTDSTYEKREAQYVANTADVSAVQVGLLNSVTGNIMVHDDLGFYRDT